MEEIRRVSKSRYIAAFSMACLIFIAGLTLGYLIDKSKVDEIISIEKEARLEIDSLTLEEKFLEQMPCSSRNPKLLSTRLDDLSTKLTYLEAQYSKNDPTILALKKPYVLLEIQHYLLLKRTVEECNLNYSFILFFYSNSPELIGTSEKQGFVLGYMQKKFTSDRIKVYSFDSDSEIDIIQTLKENYHIEAIPSIVIDNKVYAGFHDTEEIEKAVNHYQTGNSTNSTEI